MSCLTEETLRAHIDGELSDTEAATVQQHLRSCDACRSRSTEMAARAEEVRQKLHALAPEPLTDADFAYTRFLQQTDARSRRILPVWRRPIWGGMADACALVMLLSAPGRKSSWPCSGCKNWPSCQSIFPPSPLPETQVTESSWRN